MIRSTVPSANHKARARAALSRFARGAINVFRPFVTDRDALQLRSEGHLLEILTEYAGERGMRESLTEVLQRIIRERNDLLVRMSPPFSSKLRGQA